MNLILLFFFLFLFLFLSLSFSFTGVAYRLSDPTPPLAPLINSPGPFSPLSSASRTLCYPLNPLFSSPLSVFGSTLFPVSSELVPFPSDSFLPYCSNLKTSIGSCCNRTSVEFVERLFSSYDSLHNSLTSSLSSLNESTLWIHLTGEKEYNSSRVNSIQEKSLKEITKIFQTIGSSCTQCLDALAGYMQGMICLACDPLGSEKYFEQSFLDYPIIRMNNDSCSAFWSGCENVFHVVLGYFPALRLNLQNYFDQENYPPIVAYDFASFMQKVGECYNYDTICRANNCRNIKQRKQDELRNSSRMIDSPSVSLEESSGDYRLCEDCQDFFCHGAFGFRGVDYSVLDIPLLHWLNEDWIMLLCLTFRGAVCSGASNVLELIIPTFYQEIRKTFGQDEKQQNPIQSTIPSSLSSSSPYKPFHPSVSISSDNDCNDFLSPPLPLSLPSLTDTGYMFGFAYTSFLPSLNPLLFDVMTIGCSFRLTQFACPNEPLPPPAQSNENLLRLNFPFLLAVISALLFLLVLCMILSRRSSLSINYQHQRNINKENKIESLNTQLFRNNNLQYKNERSHTLTNPWLIESNLNFYSVSGFDSRERKEEEEEGEQREEISRNTSVHPTPHLHLTREFSSSSSTIGQMKWKREKRNRQL